MSFAEWTSLPNLHPAVIHFPIALLATALAIDAIAFAFRRQIWIDRMGTILWVFGAAATGVAYLTGHMAGDDLGMVVPEVESAIARHSDLAWWVLLGAIMVVAIRLAVARIARADETIRRLPTRAAVLALSVGVVGLTAVTADRGGALVYRHGVAVVRPSLPSLSAVPPAHREDRHRVVHLDDGGFVWTPSPGDGPHFSQVVEQVLDSPGALSTIADSAKSTVEGLPLQIDGRAVLLLPREFGDVQVKAVLDLSEFDGTAGVMHHYVDIRSFGSFETTETTSRLLARRDGALRVLSTGAGRARPGVVTIAVSSVGSHLKGFIADTTVAHGHMQAPGPGRTGILLEGKGVLRLRELRVMRAVDH